MAADDGRSNDARESIELVSVAAVAENRVIGDDGDIPWPSLPEDRRQYRERVAEDPVIVGRRTFEMYDRDDRPGTHQIVLSRTEREWEASTVHHADSVEDAVAVAASVGAERAFVIGGGGIYELFQPQLDRMVLTRIPDEYEGDSYYPEWDDEAWDRTAIEEFDQFCVETWIRAESDANSSVRRRFGEDA